jgi:hypothetical protein
LLLVVASLVAAPAAHAARTAPLVNYESVLVQSVDGKPLTLEQVKRAVIAGGASKQWIASAQDGDRIRFTHTRGRHTAIVEVAYTPQSYSIRYVDSTDLNYSAKETGGPVIHRTYNNWVSNLRVAIDAALKTV